MKGYPIFMQASRCIQSGNACKHTRLVRRCPPMLAPIRSEPPRIINYRYRMHPRFRNAVASDYRLRTGSPAIDRDVTLTGFNYDKEFVFHPQIAAWDIGPYEASLELELAGTAASTVIHLVWTVNITLPATNTWTIDYEGPPGDQIPPITEIPEPTRTYTLTGLTNYERYTVTLQAMADATPILTDMVRVMPTDITIYLPLVCQSVAR